MKEAAKEYYYAEALAKIESPDPSFKTMYEVLILQIEANHEDVAREKVTAYMQENYNRSYQGGVWIDMSFVKIVAIAPSIDDHNNEVSEVYSKHIDNLTAFENLCNPDFTV